jgi:hypothetical protein
MYCWVLGCHDAGGVLGVEVKAELLRLRCGELGAALHVQGSRLDDVKPSVLQGRTACTGIGQSTEALAYLMHGPFSRTYGVVVAAGKSRKPRKSGRWRSVQR